MSARCNQVWMNADVCPGNRFNTSPGVRHICDKPNKHKGVCRCPCGARPAAPVKIRQRLGGSDERRRMD